MSTTSPVNWAGLNQRLLEEVDRYIEIPEIMSFQDWVEDFQLAWSAMLPVPIDTGSPGLQAREALRNKASNYFYFFPAFLRLFGDLTPHKKAIWNDLLTEYGATGKNYTIPAPILYEHAKSLILHPFQARLVYDIQPKIQTAIRQHPFLASGASALLIALHPSMESSGMALFVGLSLYLSSPSQQRSVGKVLVGLYELMFMTAVTSALILPLILKSTVSSDIPFPIIPLLTLMGFLLIHALIAKRMISHIARFEAQNPMGINNDRHSLQRYFIQHTTAPFKTPLILSIGMALGFLLPPREYLAMKGLIALTRAYSWLEMGHLAWKLFNQKPSGQELISLALLLYQKSSVLVSLTHHPSCREITPFEMFNLRWLAFPVDSDSFLCHEVSGKQWGISTPPHTESSSVFFTAHSLRYGYEYLPKIGDVCPDEGLALIPKPSLTHPIEHLCRLSVKSCQASSWLPEFRSSLPIKIWNSEGFHQNGPFIFTTEEKIDLLKEMPLSVLLLYQAHHALNHLKKSPQEARENPTP